MEEKVLESFDDWEINNYSMLTMLPFVADWAQLNIFKLQNLKSWFNLSLEWD